MPLYVDRVGKALEARRQDFQTIEQQVQAEIEALRRSLDQFSAMSREDVESAISEINRPGARPTDEQDTQPLIVSQGIEWQHHKEARKWASQQLTGVSTFAADGSQISPSRDLSIPVGLVQIGWFENPHDSSIPYVKDVAIEILTPQDLEGSDVNFAQREVEWRRFQGEVNSISRFMEKGENQQALAFFDGSFIVSFVGGMQPERQQQYTEAVKALLTKSEQTGVPLIGFVDTSYSSDVTTLIQHAVGRVYATRISDAALLRPLMRWGDRSRIYLCSRNDEVIENNYYEKVCITYLKTTGNNPPARIEFPKWMYENNCYEWALDIVRAECVVGMGYPYAIETADATAVLTMQDRDRFHRMFQDFAEDANIPLRFSRKAMSKRGRR